MSYHYDASIVLESRLKLKRYFWNELKIEKNHSFHLDFAWKPLWEGTKTEKSLSPCVWSHRNRLECRMTTPFVLLDTRVPKQLPKSTEWHVVATRKIIYDAQSHPLRLKRVDVWIKVEDFGGFSWKSRKKVLQLAFGTIKNDWCRFNHASDIVGKPRT